MIVHRRRLLVTVAVAFCGLVLETVPGLSADLGPEPREQLPQPVPPLSQWEFSFTPYLWLPSMSGPLLWGWGSTVIKDLLIGGV